MKKKFILVALVAAVIGAAAKLLKGRMGNKDAEAELATPSL